MSQEDPDEEDPDGLRVYALRLSPRAVQDIREIALTLADLSRDPVAGERWGEGLYLELSRLATLPRRFAVAERETRLFGLEMRRMVYRRSAPSVAVSVLFTVSEAGEDGPSVAVLHIRHGGRRPMTRAEARGVLAGLGE